MNSLNLLKLQNHLGIVDRLSEDAEKIPRRPDRLKFEFFVKGFRGLIIFEHVKRNPVERWLLLRPFHGFAYQL